MTGLLELVAGTEVRCSDGRVGHLGGLIFDPEAGTITHVSVTSRSGSQNGRLVPLEVVQSADSIIQLGCTRDDYYKFPDNEEFVMPVGPVQAATVLHVHLVPRGETELKEHESVHAADGRAGRLVGVAMDRQSHAVQELLVQVGHLGSRHQVSVPFGAVATIDGHGIHLRLSKDELSAQTGLN